MRSRASARLGLARVTIALPGLRPAAVRRDLPLHHLGIGYPDSGHDDASSKITRVTRNLLPLGVPIA
jgi:hypothetical protein